MEEGRRESDRWSQYRATNLFTIVGNEIAQLEAGGWYERLLARVRSRYPWLQVDLEDAVNAAKIRALERAGDLRSQAPAAVRSWLQRITQNEIRRVLRSSQSRPRLPSLESLTDQLPAEDATRELVQGEYQASLLEQISPQARELVELRVLGGLSFGEASNAVGISVEAAKKRYYRAVKDLRQSIERERERRLGG